MSGVIFGRFCASPLLRQGEMTSNAPNAMIASLKSRSGPPDAVIAQGRNRG